MPSIVNKYAKKVKLQLKLHITKLLNIHYITFNIIKLHFFTIVIKILIYL